MSTETYQLLSVVITGVGVVVGIAVLIVYGKQLSAMRGQIGAMKTQLTVMTSENRPWLLMEWNETRDRIQEPFLRVIGDMLPPDQRLSHCSFFIKNYGKTPARALQQRTELLIGDDPSAPPAENIQTKAVVPGDTKTIAFVFPPGQSMPYEAILYTAFINEKELKAVTDRNKFVWLLANIRYRHTADVVAGDAEYESSICYLWETRFNSEKPFWRPAGPAAFNKAT